MLKILSNSININEPLNDLEHNIQTQRKSAEIAQKEGFWYIINHNQDIIVIHTIQNVNTILNSINSKYSYIIKSTVLLQLQ